MPDLTNSIEKAAKREERQTGRADNRCSTSSNSITIEANDIDIVDKPRTQEVNIEQTADVPPPPDGGYGWVCVVACLLINMFSWGVVSVSPLPQPLLTRISSPQPSLRKRTPLVVELAH